MGKIRKGLTNLPGQMNYEKQSYIGHDAQMKRGILSISYPIERGNITNWDDMEEIWGYSFGTRIKINNIIDRIGIQTPDHPIIISEPVTNYKPNREKITQIFFETYNTPSLLLQHQGVLGLYAVGKTTGLVVQVGDEVTQTLPVYEGSAMSFALKSLSYSGRGILSVPHS